MRRSLSPLVVLTLVWFQIGVEHAASQPPDLLRSYRFIRPFSVLNESGGIAGWSTDFAVGGKFDFVTGYDREPSPLPVLRPYASFENVEAWAAHPILAYVLNLDRKLNLSGLDGRPLWGNPTEFQVFQFRGETGNGDPFRMHVATLGRWMYMRGSSDPECCDQFQYTLRALAHQVPSGDTNDDGIVDEHDLKRWQQFYGPSRGSVGHDGADFLRWQRTQGETAPSPEEFDAMLNAALTAAAGASATTVPEPATVALAVGLLGVLALLRRDRL